MNTPNSNRAIRNAGAATRPHPPAKKTPAGCHLLHPVERASLLRYITENREHLPLAAGLFLTLTLDRGVCAARRLHPSQLPAAGISRAP